MKTLAATALMALSLAAPAAADNAQLVTLVQRKLDRFDIHVDARGLSTQQLAQVKFVDAESRRSRVKIRSELRAAVK